MGMHNLSLAIVKAFSLPYENLWQIVLVNDPETTEPPPHSKYLMWLSPVDPDRHYTNPKIKIIHGTLYSTNTIHSKTVSLGIDARIQRELFAIHQFKWRNSISHIIMYGKLFIFNLFCCAGSWCWSNVDYRPGYFSSLGLLEQGLLTGLWTGALWTGSH